MKKKKSFEYEYEKITNFEISKFENPKGSNVKARDDLYFLFYPASKVVA